jgi:hypothetical protein
MPECQKPTVGLSCIERLADGWLLPSDLCPACTAAFMAALDGIAGPLVWHANYTARAAK